MNKERRTKIQKAHDMISEAKLILEDVLFDEEIAFGNMPEGLQSSMRGIASEEAIETLGEVIDSLSDIMY